MDRRTFLAVPIAMAGAASLTAGALPSARDHVSMRGEGFGFELTWLGVNGWKVQFDEVRLLIDPWVTRYYTGTFL